jgi:hypothetical protein
VASYKVSTSTSTRIQTATNEERRKARAKKETKINKVLKLM